MGRYLRRSGGGLKGLVPDDRFDHRADVPAGCYGAQKGLRRQGSGRSRGGLRTKVHLLADEVGLPVAFRSTAGQAAECAQAVSLLEGQEPKL
jgi:hypothetical protein